MNKPCTECGESYCTDCAGWFAELTETENGDVCSDCLNDNYIKCQCCNHYVANDDATETPDGWVCEDCFDNNYVHCEHCNKIVSINETEESPNDCVYCARCFEDRCASCDCCGVTCWRTELKETPGGDWYCEDCFEEHCAYCLGCDCLVWQDDTYGDGYCEDCYNDYDEDSGDFDSACFRGRESYTKIGKRRYGVEIETYKCPDYLSLGGAIPFDSKHDGSISGKEFASTILYGDAGLEAIENLCEFAENHNWKVDSRCGLHIHLDVSGEKTKTLKAMALAYYLSYEFWLMLVDRSRASNMYCEKHRTDITAIRNITNFTEFARYQCRYEFVNFAAYTKHKTFEIRLHQGSIDSEEICNWIRLHSVFMDWASGMSFTKVKNRLLNKDKDEQFDYIMQLCKSAGQEDLVDYYKIKTGHVCTDYVTVAV